MSPIYVPGKLTLRQTWQPMDPDAAAYITDVETADGQALEEKVKIAIDNFVLGCKADGIWSAIKASCILAGARTLAGALVPLVGTAPTNNNFVTSDYDRKNGLIGNGSNKSLNSNRNNNVDPQNSFHYSLYATTAATTYPKAYFGVGNNETGATNFGLINASILFIRCRSSASSSLSTTGAGFLGASRNNSASFTARSNGSSSTFIQASETPLNAFLHIFSTSSGFHSNPRLAFYSIGESLDLTLLDTRVTDLINAIGVAIP